MSDDDAKAFADGWLDALLYVNDLKPPTLPLFTAAMLAAVGETPKYELPMFITGALANVFEGEEEWGASVAMSWGKWWRGPCSERLCLS